jgi:AcrR family transcriptional regulator
MSTLRRDAAKNRERILNAARALVVAGEPLQLNAVARHAEVGIGTVYRHFGSPEALAEGLVDDRFVELIAIARSAEARTDAVPALREFLTQAVRAFAADPEFAAASVNTNLVRDETRALRAELIGVFAALVRRSEDHLRPGLDALDLMILACGLGYSIRLRPEKAPLYLQALLDHIEPGSGGRSSG